MFTVQLLLLIPKSPFSHTPYPIPIAIPIPLLPRCGYPVAGVDFGTRRLLIPSSSALAPPPGPPLRVTNRTWPDMRLQNENENEITPKGPGEEAEKFKSLRKRSG